MWYCHPADAIPLAPLQSCWVLGLPEPFPRRHDRSSHVARYRSRAFPTYVATRNPNKFHRVSRCIDCRNTFVLPVLCSHRTIEAMVRTRKHREGDPEIWEGWVTDRGPCLEHGADVVDSRSVIPQVCDRCPWVEMYGPIVAHQLGSRRQPRPTGLSRDHCDVSAVAAQAVQAAKKVSFILFGIKVFDIH